jgi:cytochrome P450
MLLMFLPGLVKLFPSLAGWTKFEEMMRSNQDLVMETINEHRAELSKDLEASPRDFIDAYLVEIGKTQDTQSSFYGSFGEKSLVAVVVDMFQAGSLTTSTTLTWAVLYMVIHPEVQKKFQGEIDKVVGKNRLPSLADRPQMVYTEALINEVLRKSSIQPMGVFHAATEDVSFEGYDIPKGTHIAANQHFVHHDSKIWGDPENFRPERFLSAEGKIQKKEYLVPFSTGRRICIGETLARDELFLFLTSLYQRFDIQADPNRPMPGIEPRRVFDTLEAPEFFITLKDRRD